MGNNPKIVQHRFYFIGEVNGTIVHYHNAVVAAWGH